MVSWSNTNLNKLQNNSNISLTILGEENFNFREENFFYQNYYLNYFSIYFLNPKFEQID